MVRKPETCHRLIPCGSHTGSTCLHALFTAKLVRLGISVLCFFIYGACGGAERETGGICCPVELSSLLADSFRETDQKLLSWLQSALHKPEQTAPVHRIISACAHAFMLQSHGHCNTSHADQSQQLLACPSVRSWLQVSKRVCTEMA